MRQLLKGPLLNWVLTLFLLVATAYGRKWKDTGSPVFIAQDMETLQKISRAQQDHPVTPKSTGRTKHNIPVESSLKKPQQTSCRETGLFPVTGSCSYFYYCEDRSGQGLELSAFMFTCPRGKLFDAEAKKCLSPLSNRRPVCSEDALNVGAASTNDDIFTTGADGYIYEANPGDIIIGNSQILNRRKRSQELSDTTSVHCNKEIIENLYESTKEACVNARSIGNYITKLESIQPLELSSFVDEIYKWIIRDYNSDLTTAQHYYKEWKSGNSLFNAIKETFLLAKQFEPKFNREFAENQKRVNKIANTEQPDIKQMQEDIKNLQIEIKEIEAVINLAQNSSDQTALTYLQNSLQNKQEALNELITNDERMKAEKELQELIGFLEFVRSAVVDIQEKSIDTGSKIEVFQERIVKDSGIFLRHRENAKEGIQRMQNEKRNNENERVQIQNRKRNLEYRISQERSDISQLRNSIQNAERELRNAERALARKQKAARDKQIIGGSLFVIPIYGWIAGGVLLGIGVEEEKSLVSAKRNAWNYYRYRLDTHNSQINRKYVEIQSVANRIAALIEMFHKLGFGLSYFGKLDKDLERLQNDVNSILPYINKALLSVAEFKDVFDGIRQNLDDIIDVAKSRKKKVEEKDLKYFIYENISALKCKWDQASIKIVTVGECD